MLGVACGATVANLYYAQPLLTLIAGSFGVSEGTAALVVTCTQIGYAAALLLVLPLGDLVENRTLVTRVLLGTAGALLLGAAAPGFAVFAAASALIGVTSVVAQILVPLLAVAGVLLDLAVQSHQVLSQQEIYALRADARARINTVYMTCTFVAGAAASAAAGALHAVSGRTAVCLFDAALPLLGLIVWAARLRPSLANRDLSGLPAGRP